MDKCIQISNPRATGNEQRTVGKKKQEVCPAIVVCTRGAVERGNKRYVTQLLVAIRELLEEKTKRYDPQSLVALRELLEKDTGGMSSNCWTH